MIFWKFNDLKELEFVKHFDNNYEIINMVTYNRISENSGFNGCIFVKHANNCFYIIFNIYEHTELNKLIFYNGKATFDKQYNLCNSIIFTIREFCEVN